MVIRGIIMACHMPRCLFIFKKVTAINMYTDLASHYQGHTSAHLTDEKFLSYLTAETLPYSFGGLDDQ